MNGMGCWGDSRLLYLVAWNQDWWWQGSHVLCWESCRSSHSSNHEVVGTCLQVLIPLCCTVALLKVLNLSNKLVYTLYQGITDLCWCVMLQLRREEIIEIYGTRHIGRHQAQGLVSLMDFFCFSEVNTSFLTFFLESACFYPGLL